MKWMPKYQAIRSVPKGEFREFEDEDGSYCGIARDKEGLSKFAIELGWNSLEEFLDEMTVTAEELFDVPLEVIGNRLYFSCAIRFMPVGSYHP